MKETIHIGFLGNRPLQCPIPSVPQSRIQGQLKGKWREYLRSKEGGATISDCLSVLCKHVSWTFRSVKVVVVVVSLIGVASYPQARQSRRIARHARRDVHATRLFFQGEGKTVQKRTTVPPLMPSK